MAHFKVLLAVMLILSVTTTTNSKIILPNKLRYLENMLNSEVMAKAAKIRQRLESNPNNVQDTVDSKMWPLLLVKYGQNDNKLQPTNMYDRRAPDFQYFSQKA